MPNNYEKTIRTYDFSGGERDPYKNTKISLLLPARDKESNIKIMLESFCRTCSNLDSVELLVKVDSDKPIDPINKILMDSPIRYKLVTFPRYHGYWDQHYAVNDLCRIARGKMLWWIGSDVTILKGDWFDTIWSTRNCFKDNIYAVHIGEYPRRPKTAPLPLVSKEWFCFFGCFAPVSNSDSFVTKLARSINRYVENTKNEIHMDHKGPHGYMKKDISSSLKEKRDFTIKMIEQYKNIFLSTHPTRVGDCSSSP